MNGAEFAQTILSGPLLAALGVSALVGLLGFASPCVLPLVPGYLSYVAGLSGLQSQPADVPTRAADGGSGADTSSGSASGATATAVVERPQRGRMLLGACLFVLGFTAVFVSFGAVFGGLGRALLEYQDVITRVLGVLTILFGLAFLGKIPGLQREFRLQQRPGAGLAGAPLLGIAFGLGWTPCLGPTLGAVQTLAYTEASAWRGALLAIAYCVGLGVPFLLIAAGFRWASTASAFARRHARTIMRIGGVAMIVLGVLLVTGAWDQLMIWLRGWLAATGLGTTSL